MDKTLAEEFEDLNLIELFQTHKYPDKPDVIKSSKSKDAVLYQGYYYNFLFFLFQLSWNIQMYASQSQT